MRMTTLFHHMTLFVRLNTVRDSKPNNNSPELFVSVVITDNDLWLSGRPWLVRFRISSRCNSIESTNVGNVTTISRDGKGKLLFEENSESGVFDRGQSDRSAIGTAFSGIESRVNS